MIEFTALVREASQVSHITIFIFYSKHYIFDLLHDSDSGVASLKVKLYVSFTEKKNSL